MSSASEKWEPVDPAEIDAAGADSGEIETGSGPGPAPAPAPAVGGANASPASFRLLERLRSRGAVMVMLLVVGSLLVTLIAGYFLGYFSAPASPLLRYVPEDVDTVAVWRMPDLLSNSDALEDFDGFEVRAWELPYGLDGYELRVGGLVLDTWQVSEYMMAVNLEADTGLSLLHGEFVFDYVREDLNFLGLEEESYRGYEVWSGDGHYALFPDDRVIVVAADQGALRQVVNLRRRGADMLPDAPDHGLNQLMERLGPAGFVFASVDRDTEWGCPVKRCQGYGLALTGYDVAEVEAQVDFAVLFSSERAAQMAADEYDEVLDFAESVPRNGFFDYGGAVVVVDAVADGEFVVGQAAVSP